MQYHFDGFHPGDPEVSSVQTDPLTDKGQVDVLIVGCGPAGLTLAAQLSKFPDICTRIVERKSGPLEIGQADGVACRSVEMFEAFGFAHKVVREAYWVNETSFWKPDPDGVIARSDRIQDVEDDLSEMPHVILSQARIHDFFLETMRNGPTGLVPDYQCELVGLERTSDPEFPVLASLRGSDGEPATVRAKFVVGCDGARSSVRNALGYELKGEAARQLWGVMDVLAVTDFPDIRLKCAIQSKDQGSILIIPREGGTMVRLYIELDELKERERAADRGVTADMLAEKASAILKPFRFDVRQVAWCSAYEIGQRVCDSFDDLDAEGERPDIPRIFIAGDACHTHSPKAGQGMNVSMADTFNLGWKLAAVLRGQAKPELLGTYSLERRAKAHELIAFDREMARLFSSKRSDPKAAKQFQHYFQKHARYTAGVETCYDASLIVGDEDHQQLAIGFGIGTRFHSGPVIRLADAKPLQLGHVLKVDGRWRLIAFAPSRDTGLPVGQIAHLCDYLRGDPNSPIARYTPSDADADSVFDVRAVFQSHHQELAIEAMPEFLKPIKGRLGLIDYEKIFCPDLKQGPDIFDLRGVDRKSGALVVVRPDQFVADILPLNHFEHLEGFFSRFMIPV
ncbi:MAG: FAD-dependent monooxygenase [Pseudomonadota bacterium]